MIQQYLWMLKQTGRAETHFKLDGEISSRMGGIKTYRLVSSLAKKAMKRLIPARYQQ